MEVFFRDLDNFIAKYQQQATEPLHELIIQINQAKKKVITLVESIREGFFVLDQAWRFTYLNQQAEVLWKRSRNDLLGKVIWEEFPLTVGSMVHEKYLQAVNEQVDVHFETVSPTMGKWLEIHAYPSQEGLSVLMLDITKKRESQKFLRLIEDIVNSTSDAIVTGAIDGVITSWNPGAQALYGYSAEEVIGQHINFVIPEERHAKVDAIFNRVRQGETIANYYAWHRNRNGAPLALSLSVFPLRDAHGQVTSYASIMRDVTDRMQMEQELQHFFDISADIMMITDLQGRIIRANQAFEKTLGYPIDEVVGRKAIELVVEEDAASAVKYHQFCNDRKLPVHVYEFRYRHRDGTSRMLQWNAVPVPEQGRFYTIARDMTAQRKLEQELDKSNRRSSKILESIKDGFFAVDREWKLTYVNGVARNLSGLTSERLIGRSLWEIFPNAEKSTVYQQFHEAIGQQIPLNFECWVNVVHGWYEFNIYPTADRGLLIYFYDLSEVINARQQLQRLESLQLVNQMAAGISHEVRNPLTAVRGFLQVLHENRDFAGYGEYFDVMLSELDRANSIISEFLNLAKDKPVPLSLININQIVDKLQPLIEADVSTLGHELVLELAEVPLIPVNENEIRQLILNLVRNAAEAMDLQGCIKIATYTTGTEVVLAVQDEGCGIQPEYMDKIGTPFFTTKENGTGLGLATCFSIAERHGAKIQLHSSPQEGTVVKVCFNRGQMD